MDWDHSGVVKHMGGMGTPWWGQGPDTWRHTNGIRAPRQDRNGGMRGTLGGMGALREGGGKLIGWAAGMRAPSWEGTPWDGRGDPGHDGETRAGWEEHRRNWGEREKTENTRMCQKCHPA